MGYKLRNKPINRKSKITVPEHANPYARLVFSEMKRQCVTYAQLEWESGVQLTTLKEWRVHKNPSLTSLEAVLGALNWWFVPTPEEKNIPPHILEKIKAIAEEWADFDEVLGRVIIGMCRPDYLMPRRDGESFPIKGKADLADTPLGRSIARRAQPA